MSQSGMSGQRHAGSAEAEQAHPSVSDLALFSGKDLSFFDGLKVRWHVSRCADCRAAIQDFRQGSLHLRETANQQPLPLGEREWARLEREMLGNVAVGVAAGRCIDNVGRRRVLFHTSWLIAGLAVLFVIAWFTHIPAEQNARLWAALAGSLRHPQMERETELRATGNGIAVRTQGATLTLLHPQSAVVSLAGSSAVTARYVDEETGQITINKVYAQ